MALGIPSVVGAITEWMNTVAVEGCTPGAEIVVQTTDGAEVAKTISGGGFDRVPVNVGVVLQPGKHLIARQTLAPLQSEFTPLELAVEVGASPTSNMQLPPMSFRSRLF